MARTRGRELMFVLVAGALATTASSAAATGGCAEVQQLTAQGASAVEIANAFNAPLAAVQACLQPQGGAVSRHAAVGPAGNAPINAVGPSPLGAAGPPPLGAAGPPPLGAAGPPPLGAPGPPPLGAAGPSTFRAGTTASSSSSTTTKR